MKKWLFGIAVVAALLITGVAVAESTHQAEGGYYIAGFPRGA
ncbi:lysogeny pheromone AimP family peptide [Bacillus glycinifermentans]|uniref:Lysogeny pheromone AimP family peptide n=1 Tax=Bacillus glycinifermentans TaxID=1664069 RepID=A0ABU6GXB2_9BACI|nr:lysogeny pheromone AimP family peptide [Bacillus glycinifermentans]MEC0483403.1 lysogeny pheromone AimP family peptide [Bacillus glycinifermentans]NUJ16814.1 lysogeny pheromone AimP family peptide [Bacillus glycinifermentans]